LEEEAASSILPYITSFVELHVLAVEILLSPLPFSAQIQWFEREEVLGVGLARQRRSRRPQGGGGRQGRQAGSSNERWGEWEEERREMRGVPQIPFSTLFLDHRIKMEKCLKD
jgi:hypothetical protein